MLYIIKNYYYIWFKHSQIKHNQTTTINYHSYYFSIFPKTENHLSSYQETCIENLILYFMIIYYLIPHILFLDISPIQHTKHIASSYTYLLYFTLFFTYLISIKSKYIRRVFNGLSETIPLYDFSCSSVLNIKSKPFFL